MVTTLGEITEDNPLALGVWFALTNSNGTPIKYMAIQTDDSAGYLGVLDKATDRRDVYTLVPMTKDPLIQTDIATHVDARSSPLNNQWRIAFFNGDSSAISELIEVGEIYPIGGTTKYDAADLLATVIDDPNTSGTQFTKVLWDVAALPAGGGFVDLGVRAGDLFRTNYQGDGFGTTTFEEYTIDSVISNQEMRLVSGPANAINVARRFSVQRSQTKTEEATAYGAKAAVFANRRIYYVWPDVIEDASGDQISGIYLCAAIAGLISAVVPQRGLTRLAIEGFSEVSRTTDYFASSQLDIMAGLGIWITMQDPETAQIFSRHEISTDPTDVKVRELMITKNVDSISFIFFNQLDRFIGRANVTDRFLLQLRRQVLGTVDFLKANGSTPELGGQLITAEIVELRQHAINLDQVVVVIAISVPFPVNVIELKLVI